jgi:hypothetical protein
MAITVCFINKEWKLVSNTISVRILVGQRHDNDFWRQYEKKFLLSSQEAKRIFRVQGTSTASERVIFLSLVILFKCFGLH